MRPIGCCCDHGAGIAYVTKPFAAAWLTGRYFVRATATGLNIPTGIWLLRKGWPVIGFLSCTPRPLKSPLLIMAAVGMCVLDCGGADRFTVPCNPAKKNSLSLMILPPIVPP